VTEIQDSDRPAVDPAPAAPVTASHFVLPEPPPVVPPSVDPSSFDPPPVVPPSVDPSSFDPPPVDPPSAPESGPAYDPPAVDPPSPAPPPDRYGAIAVNSAGGTGRAWNYPSASAAQQQAMAECPGTGCKVLTTFSNGCGAVAYNPATRRYWGGHGKTRAEAEQAAIDNVGGGNWIAWVCTG